MPGTGPPRLTLAAEHWVYGRSPAILGESLRSNWLMRERSETMQNLFSEGLVQPQPTIPPSSGITAPSI